jgi:hypothetical protein
MYRTEVDMYRTEVDKLLGNVMPDHENTDSDKIENYVDPIMCITFCCSNVCATG